MLGSSVGWLNGLVEVEGLVQLVIHYVRPLNESDFEMRKKCWNYRAIWRFPILFHWDARMSITSFCRQHCSLISASDHTSSSDFVPVSYCRLQSFTYLIFTYYRPCSKPHRTEEEVVKCKAENLQRLKYNLKASNNIPPSEIGISGNFSVHAQDDSVSWTRSDWIIIFKRLFLLTSESLPLICWVIKKASEYIQGSFEIE